MDEFIDDINRKKRKSLIIAIINTCCMSLELDVCFVGIPLDVGANNRTGTRFGPRAIRSESVMIRECNNDTGEK